MKYLWLIWLIGVMAFIGLPGYIGPADKMTSGQKLFFLSGSIWTIGLPILLLIVHVVRAFRQRQSRKNP